MIVGRRSVCQALAVAAALGLGLGNAQAAVYAWLNSNGFITIDEVGLPGSNRYKVTIQQDAGQGGGPCLVGLDSNSTTDVIEEIIFEQAIDENMEFVEGIYTLIIYKEFDSSTRSTISGIESIQVVEPTTTRVTLSQISIAGYIGSPNLGEPRSFQVSRCGEINIGGNWYADVIANDLATGVGQDFELAQTDSSILGGGILNNSGEINSVVVMGSVSDFDNRTPEIFSPERIGQIQIEGDATIRIGSTGEGFTGHHDVDSVAIGGDLLAAPSEMTMKSLQSLDVAGSFFADVEIEEPMSATALYQIGGTFDASGSLDLMGTDGLAGQIIINQANSSSSWDGDIKVNGASLSGDEYINTAASLGGGSVGLAPFKLHEESCDPVDSSAVFPVSGEYLAGGALARQYGPVTSTDLSQHAPVTIKRRHVNSAGSWDDVTGDPTGDGFTYSFDEQDRSLRIHNDPSSEFKLWQNYDYEIRPVRSGSGALVCDGVTGAPLVGVDDATDEGYVYAFTVATSCPGDLDGDGQVAASDLAIVVGSWGPCPNPPPAQCTSDLSGDRDVGAVDLANVLSYWGPCGGASMMMGGGGGGSLASSATQQSAQSTSGTPAPAVLQQLGFSTIEAYDSYISGLTQAQLNAHIVDLLELLMED